MAVAEVAAPPGGSLTLVCGPSGGGKSRWAEHLASGSGLQVVYLATGPLRAEDGEWQRRLERHRRRRPAHWRSLEVGGQLCEGLHTLEPGQLGLVDSLGTWVSAWLDSAEGEWQDLCSQLLTALTACPVPLLLVCEEVGWGVVPATAAGGRFRTRMGLLVQELMARSDGAWLVLAGRALDLGRLSLPVPQED